MRTWRVPDSGPQCQIRNEPFLDVEDVGDSIGEFPGLASNVKDRDVGDSPNRKCADFILLADDGGRIDGHRAEHLHERHTERPHAIHGARQAII